MSIYQFEVNLTNGETIKLEKFQDKAMLIVNTASECGFTPQYEGLEKLYENYHGQGLEVLGFPCNQFGGQEPGTNEEIAQFCSTNYKVTFPLFEKIDVNGEGENPLYHYLKSQAPEATEDIKWNFTKFLVDKTGKVIKRYESKVRPESIEADIKNIL